MLRTVAIVLALSATASADPENRVAVTGANARVLTLGLKLAGITVSKTSGSPQYTVTNVMCTTIDGGVLDDGLDVSSCQVNTGKALTPTESAILADAITGTLGAKGLPTDTHMSKTAIKLASLSCTIYADAKAPKSVDRYHCEAGLRDSLLITPKKVKVKDIVQPVKIQKQELQPDGVE